MVSSSARKCLQVLTTWLLVLLWSPPITCSLGHGSTAVNSHVRGAKQYLQQQQLQQQKQRRGVRERFVENDTAQQAPRKLKYGKSQKASSSYEFEAPGTLSTSSPDLSESSETDDQGDEASEVTYPYQGPQQKDVENPQEAEEDNDDEDAQEAEAEEDDNDDGDEDSNNGKVQKEKQQEDDDYEDEETHSPPEKDATEPTDDEDENGPVESGQEETSNPETDYWHMNSSPPTQNPTVYDPSTNYWHINTFEDTVEAEEQQSAPPTQAPTIYDVSSNYWHIDTFNEEDEQVEAAEAPTQDPQSDYWYVPDPAEEEERTEPPTQTPTVYDPSMSYWHMNEEFDKETNSPTGSPTVYDPSLNYWHLNDFDEDEEVEAAESPTQGPQNSEPYVVSLSEEEDSDGENYWQVNSEGDNEEEVTTTSVAEKTGNYYYRQLTPFVVEVRADNDISGDLGIPLYLMLEMESLLPNLVNMHITNLTVRMGVEYPGNRRLNAPTRGLAGDSIEHFHTSSLYFHGSAEFSSDIIHSDDDVKGVQASVLSDEAKLQQFWNTESPGMDPSLTVISISPEGLQQWPEYRQGQQEEETQQEQEEKLPAAFVAVLDERDSNVGVIVGVVVPLVAICLCIICIAGRIRFIAKGAQERYNKKYGLYGYEGYGQNLDKEDIFKEEFLAPSEPDYSHSHSSIDFLVHPIKTVRRLSKVKKAKHSIDEISTEEAADKDVLGAFPSAPRQTSRNERSNKYRAPSTKQQRSEDHSLLDEVAQSPDVFSNEDIDDEYLTPEKAPAPKASGGDAEVFSNEYQNGRRPLRGGRQVKGHDDGVSVSSGRTMGSSVSSGRKGKSFDEVSSTGSFYSCRSARSSDMM